MRKFLLSVCGLGFIPGAPGTYASALTVAAVVSGSYLGAPVWVWPTAAALTALLLLTVGVPEGRDSGGKDPRWCVLDEVCGTFIAVSLLPTDSILPTASGALVLFRIFDILKPPPVRQLEALDGSWGVLADDVAAGVLANIVVHLTLWVL